MIRPAALSTFLLVCLLPARAQSMTDVYIPGAPPPPASMDRDRARTSSDEPKLPPRHADLAKLQQEANDLARLAQTIPTDMAGVRQGLLPKDISDKLKRIEKLSKQLRNELNP